MTAKKSLQISLKQQKSRQDQTGERWKESRVRDSSRTKLESRCRREELVLPFPLVATSSRKMINADLQSWALEGFGQTYEQVKGILEMKNCCVGRKRWSRSWDLGSWEVTDFSRDSPALFEPFLNSLERNPLERNSTPFHSPLAARLQPWLWRATSRDPMDLLQHSFGKREDGARVEQHYPSGLSDLAYRERSFYGTICHCVAVHLTPHRLPWRNHLPPSSGEKVHRSWNHKETLSPSKFDLGSQKGRGESAG